MTILDNLIINRHNLKTLELGLDMIGEEYLYHVKKSVPMIENASYYGTVGFIQKVVEDFKYTHDPIAHVPEDMLDWAGRPINKMTLRDALQLSKFEPLFVKPESLNNKHFTGTIINSRSIITFANYDENSWVLSSPVLEFVSEWRCFVLHGEVVGIRPYTGDCLVFPDKKVILSAIEAWKTQPHAFCIDIGITKSNKTCVVECNDVMSLGWYGLMPIVAARMLVTRWEEIHAEKKL